MKKRIFGLAMAAMMILSVFGLAGCDNSHGIPNGDYHDSIEGDLKGFPDYFWRIKGNNATLYFDAHTYYKCEIVDENGKIFFVFDGKDRRGYISYFRYNAEYDESTKKLTTYNESAKKT